MTDKELHTWLLETVRFYRHLGFFASRQALSDEALAVELGQGLSGDDIGDDVQVYGQDESRVWWGDHEADIGAEWGGYRDLLEALAVISQGRFTPTDIEEEVVDEDAGPVYVRFTLGGVRHGVQPAFLGQQWLDTGVLQQINGAISADGYRFEAPDMSPHSDFVVLMLTADEKRRLERGRGVRFCF